MTKIVEKGTFKSIHVQMIFVYRYLKSLLLKDIFVIFILVIVDMNRINMYLSVRRITAGISHGTSAVAVVVPHHQRQLPEPGERLHEGDLLAKLLLKLLLNFYSNLHLGP